MYAMKQPDPSVSTPRQHYSYLPLIIVAALLIVVTSALVAWKIYHNHQVATDKARFAQAERDISDLSRQIVAAAGQPAKTESDKYCSRPNLKLDKGPLSCDVMEIYYFSVNDASEGTQKLTDITKPINLKWRLVKSSSSNNSGDGDAFVGLDYSSKTPYQQKNKYYQMFDGMECVSSYYLYDRDTLPSPDSYYTESGLVLGLILSCGDYAKIQHYPMKS